MKNCIHKPGIAWCICLVGILFVTGCEWKAEEGPFSSGRILGANTNAALAEASGLAASRRYPGFLWSHNDSGHPPELFLLDSTGQTQITFRLTGVRNRDWEDIAIGPGPDSSTWLYIGDIGDNAGRHRFKRVYMLSEPDRETDSVLMVADTLVIRLADKPRDTEALLVDPLTRNLYLVSKREKEVKLYEIQFPFGDTVAVEPLMDLPFRHVTAGDISRDGTEILLKSYTTIYYWDRRPGESVPEALRRPAVELTYDPEPIGEAVAWASDGSGYYTLSENPKGEQSQLLFYVRRNPKKE